MKQEKNNTPPAAQNGHQRLKPAEASVAPAPSESTQKRWRRKRWLVGLALVFFLFSVIFIVPVSHIPGLRNLAWMMGFSAQDTQSMSFARTLLTWAGDGERRVFSGNWSGRDTESLSVFDKNARQDFNASGPRSGLFDLGALNASRRAQGLRADGLADAYYGDLSDEERAALNRRVNGWSEEARRAAAEREKAEVYFGQDAQLAAKAAGENPQEQGSADTSKLLTKANITGSVRTDWLGQAIDKASLLTLGPLDDALGDKATQGTTTLSNIGGSLKDGKRPQRDLATVWLMSGAANKARQLMLKKQLASAGYMAMDMPQKVFDSSGEGSGVRLAGDEMIASFEDASRQLLNEEQCRDLAQQANSNIKPLVDQSYDSVRQIRSSVPTECGDGITRWKEQLQTVKSNCQKVKDTFSNMKSFCGVQLKRDGRCETTYLDSYASDLSSACDALAAAKAMNPPDEQAVAQAQQKLDEAKKIDKAQLDNTFNINVDGTAGDNDFFPETEANTGWLGGS